MDTDAIARADEILEHAGVKGMKWGVRRNKKSKTAPGSRNYDPKKLSNADLKKVVARMKLEQQYVDINKKTSEHGKGFAHEVMKRTRQVVITTLTAAVAADIKSVYEGKEPKFANAAKRAGKTAGSAAAGAARKHAGKATYKTAAKLLELGTG